MFDEEPDRDPHGECRAEIARLTALRCDCDEESGSHAPTCVVAVREQNVEMAAEIARLTAELAAARAVPADVEAAIAHAVGCGLDEQAAMVLRASIARAISDATAARGTVGGLLATAPVGSIVEFVDCAFWYQARVHVDDSVEWYETRRRHATDARWMPWKRGIPPVRPSARLVPAAEAAADPNQRGPLPKGG